LTVSVRAPGVVSRTESAKSAKEKAMKGTVLSYPVLSDNEKRIAFNLLQEGTYQVVYCHSRLQCDKAKEIKIGDKLDLEGVCVTNPQTGKLDSFVFDSLIKI